MADDDYKKSAVALGAFIREHRKSAGLSQQTIGDLLGLNQSAIARIEAGQQWLNFLELIRLTAILDFNLAEAAEAVLNVAEKKGGQLK